MRQGWDEYFMTIARTVATRSTCPRMPNGGIGALLVRARKILGTGYGGSVAGQPHCTEVGCLIIDGGCKRTVHAEQNALLNAACDVRGATIYTTTSPCLACFHLLAQAGVTRIVYADEYRIVEPQRHLAIACGIEWVHLPTPVAAPPPAADYALTQSREGFYLKSVHHAALTDAQVATLTRVLTTAISDTLGGHVHADGPIVNGRRVVERVALTDCPSPSRPLWRALTELYCLGARVLVAADVATSAAPPPLPRADRLVEVSHWPVPSNDPATFFKVAIEPNEVRITPPESFSWPEPQVAALSDELRRVADFYHGSCVVSDGAVEYLIVFDNEVESPSQRQIAIAKSIGNAFAFVGIRAVITMRDEATS